jgi:thiol:disulfide interchange protein DsbC
MKIIGMLLTGSLLFLAPAISQAYPPQEGKSQNCLDCHKLEKKDAEELVKKIAPGGTIVEIKAAPVKGMWQIDVDANGRRGTIFLDFSRKYLAGQLVPVDTLGPKKTDFSKIPLKDAVVLGSKTAKKKIAVFTDPDCPYCRQLHEVMKQVIAKRQDVAFHVFMYPLPMHKDAYKKAQAVLCEKSLALMDDAFSGKAMPEPKCGNEQLETSLALGRGLKIEGTPALIREDGLILGGFLPTDKLIDWIDGK